MIRHPGASAVVPFLSDPEGDDPQLLLIKQYRYAAEQYLYEIPAGRLEPGEDPRDCAIRELREETGCTARQMEFLTTIYTTPGFTDERIHLFMATGLERGETAHEADEFMTVETMTLSEALRLIEEGRSWTGRRSSRFCSPPGIAPGVRQPTVPGLCQNRDKTRLLSHNSVAFRGRSFGRVRLANKAQPIRGQRLNTRSPAASNGHTVCLSPLRGQRDREVSYRICSVCRVVPY